MPTLMLLAVTLLTAPDTGTPELFRLKGFTFGAEYARVANDPHLSVMSKLSKDGKCQVSYATQDGVSTLSLSENIGTPEQSGVLILEFTRDGRDLVARRFGHAYPPQDTKRVEHYVATTKRGGKMLTVEWSSGFYGSTAELKLELDEKGHTRYAFAEMKSHGAHLASFFMRDTVRAECQLQ
ncbi:MAG: hypothetical protein ACAI38_12860 [Myxococcota bacterium]